MNNNEPVFAEHPPGGYYKPGLTKREYFAAMAMQGFLGGNQRLGDMFPYKPRGTFAEAIAVAALSYADALLNELNKEK